MKFIVMVFVMLLAGCGSPLELMSDSSMEVMDGGQDSSWVPEDSGDPDGEALDAQAPDAEVADSAPRDSGPGRSDAAEGGADPDGGGLLDSGTPDTAEADSGVVEDAEPDGETDSGGELDAGPPARLGPVEISAWAQIFCARDEVDSVWCWGRGFTGIEYVGSFTSIAGMCGIRHDGTVACFNTGVAIPVETADGPLMASAVGETSFTYRGCAINGGEVWCWDVEGLAIMLPTIMGATAVDSTGCATSPTSTWCWDYPLTGVAPVRVYTGGIAVHVGGEIGSGVCVDRVSGLGVYCNGGNRDCAIRGSSEMASGVFRSTAMGFTPYTIGLGHCQVVSDGVVCEGPGAGFGGDTPCDLRSLYPLGVTEVVQLETDGTDVCALLRVEPGPLTIECWGAGSPVPVAW